MPTQDQRLYVADLQDRLFVTAERLGRLSGLAALPKAALALRIAAKHAEASATALELALSLVHSEGKQ